MSSSESDYCPVIKEEDEFIESDEDGPLFISAKLKSANEGNLSMCDRSSEFNNFEKNSPFCLVKIEPEDSTPGPDDLHQVQGAENLAFKKEEVEIEEHKPGWGLIKRGVSSSNVEMLKDGLVQCESVRQSESRSSEITREEQAKYNCAHCPYKTNTRANFFMHYKRMHSKEAKVFFKCEECSYETKWKENFIQHNKIKHSKDGEMYKCQECSYETRYKSALPSHYKINHFKDVEMYNCQECSYKTEYKGDLTKRYKIKHIKDAEMYKCPECSYETKWKRNLIRHYKYKHSKDADVYKCAECQYETKIKTNLVRHYMSIHSIRRS